MIKLLTFGERVLILLDDESLDRIRCYDPAILDLGCIGMPAIHVGISYANDDDMRVILEHAKAGRIEEAIAHATRGFEYKPEEGDHDMGPVSLLHDPKVDA